MTGFLTDAALKIVGLDDADIVKLNARLPDIANLITVVQTHQAQLNRVLTDCLPMVQKVIAKERESK